MHPHSSPPPPASRHVQSIATPATATAPATKTGGSARAGAPAVCWIGEVTAGAEPVVGDWVGMTAIEELDEDQRTALDEGAALLVGRGVDETGEVGDCAAAYTTV